MADRDIEQIADEAAEPGSMAVITYVPTSGIMSGGLAFKYRPGGSFISVWKDTAEKQIVPLDMIQVPDWVNRTRVDKAAMKAILWWAGWLS